MAMKDSMVIDGSDITFGLLEELFKQLKSGAKDPSKGLTGVHIRALLEHRNPFDRKELEKVLPNADEETESNYCYPDGFHFRTVDEQVETLLKHFPNLDASHVQELASGEFPEGAEGWAVIPKSDKIGTYHDALAKALELLVKGQKFQNWIEGKLTERHLRLKEKTAQAHAKLNEQPGDFWVFPFQFSKKWRGHSVQDAQVVRFAESEFGLGPYEAAILMLTHPDRITGPNQLYIDCAGCEYRPAADGDFFACPDFRWGSYYERLELYYSRTDDVYERWGAVSGFRAQ